MGEDRLRVYVKCVLTGEPARIVLELKRRGVVCSVKEAVVQGLLVYYDVVLERDLRRREAEGRAGRVRA